LFAFLISSLCDTCPDHLILPDLVTMIAYGEAYKFEEQETFLRVKKISGTDAFVIQSSFCLVIDHKPTYKFCMKEFLCVEHYKHGGQAQLWRRIWVLFNVIWICTSENYSQKWISKLYNDSFVVLKSLAILTEATERK
jgi:hypothetical protein